jgi:hypothetical protein
MCILRIGLKIDRLCNHSIIALQIDPWRFAIAVLSQLQCLMIVLQSQYHRFAIALNQFAIAIVPLCNRF